MTTKYQYESIPLTSGVFADLATQVTTPGEVVHRGELAARVRERHIYSGGADARGSLASVAKKALADLQRSGGVAQAGAPGFWRFPLDSPAERTPERPAVFVVQCDATQAEAVLSAIRSVSNVTLLG